MKAYLTNFMWLTLKTLILWYSLCFIATEFFLNCSDYTKSTKKKKKGRELHFNLTRKWNIQIQNLTCVSEIKNTKLNKLDFYTLINVKLIIFLIVINHLNDYFMFGYR